MKYRNIIKHNSYIRAFILFAAFSVFASADSIWSQVDDGLFVGEFPIHKKSVIGDSRIIIIKIDPQIYQLKLFSASERRHENLTVEKWCKKYKLLAAINAGMFQTDNKSNVGYMKNFAHLNNSRINPKYFSVAAFNPLDKTNPAFQIFDIDETLMDTVLKRYNTVVQNLRLIKRDGENRWSRQSKKWSEAALGQDRSGNVLFIFSRTPYSMYDLNNIVLDLPINLICAQHLEGGPEASLYFSHKNKKLECVGSFESAFHESDGNIIFWPVPNVLGIVKRK